MLSWNEIRHRSIKFSRDWKGTTSEKSERQTFWNEFFDIFGIKRRTVTSFEGPVEKLSANRGYIEESPCLLSVSIFKRLHVADILHPFFDAATHGNPWRIALPYFNHLGSLPYCNAVTETKSCSREQYFVDRGGVISEMFFNQ